MPSDSGTDASTDLSPVDLSSMDMIDLDMSSLPDDASNDASMDAGSSDAQADAGDDMSLAPRGTCISDEDCPEGTCVSLPNEDGGWKTCASAPMDPSTCDQAPDSDVPDLCCLSNECTLVPDGQCVRGPVFYCGGVPPVERNECFYPDCSSDSDCTASANGLCIPTGAFGEPVARCVYGDCRLDAECPSRAGGKCVPFFNPCNNRLTGFSCTYEDSACRSDDDCRGQGGIGQPYCAPGVDGATTCESFLPPP